MQTNRLELNDYIEQYKELDLHNKPIQILLKSSKLRSILCNALNYEQVIPNEDGLNRDYRGLADLLELPLKEIRNLELRSDPTLSILIYLDSLSTNSFHNLNNNNSNNNSNNNNNNSITNHDKIVNRFCTIDFLIHALEKLDRFDVIDDLLNEIKLNPIDESTIQEIALFNKSNQIRNSFQDTKYDAYVSYVESDRVFVEQLCNILESPDINLKLFIRDRDLLMGTMEYADFTELMEKRCNKLLVILSPEFLESSEYEFQTKFTFSLQIEEQQRRLIPIIHKSCKLPSLLGCLSKIDLSENRGAMVKWNWQKLVSSLSNNLNERNQLLPITNSLSSLSITTLNSSSNSCYNSGLNNLNVQNVVKNSHSASSNYASSSIISQKKANGSLSDKKISKIINVDNEFKINDKSDKLNSSIKLNNNKSAIFDSSTKSSSLTTATQTFSTDDTRVLIEKQKNSKFFTRFFNKFSKIR